MTFKDWDEDPEEVMRRMDAQEARWHLDEQARDRMEQHSDEVWWVRPLRHIDDNEDPRDD